MKTANTSPSLSSRLQFLPTPCNLNSSFFLSFFLLSSILWTRLQFFLPHSVILKWNSLQWHLPCVPFTSFTLSSLSTRFAVLLIARYAICFRPFLPAAIKSTLQWNWRSYLDRKTTRNDAVAKKKKNLHSNR